MYRQMWDILLVDDESDVLSVSKLAMQNFKVHGLPLRLHRAESKAAAIELLENNVELVPTLAVAFIDVVMETEQAGLELCRYIRETCGNKLTQLFIRTGQPGMAPERAVIDRYDINGYFTKAEATEDKLYSLVKSGVRQYHWSITSFGCFEMIRAMNMAAGSRGQLAAILQQTIESMIQDPSGTQVDSFSGLRFSFLIGDETVAQIGWEDNGAMLALRDRLDQAEGIALNDTGDQYVVSDDNRLLIKTAARPGHEAGYFMSNPNFVADYAVRYLGGVLSCLASLWPAAK